LCLDWILLRATISSPHHPQRERFIVEVAKQVAILQFNRILARFSRLCLLYSPRVNGRSAVMIQECPAFIPNGSSKQTRPIVKRLIESDDAGENLKNNVFV
jgi:hypothetical protein